MTPITALTRSHRDGNFANMKKHKTRPKKTPPPSDIPSLGLIAKRHHDLHVKTITLERFLQAQEFIQACGHVGLWRLMQGQMSGKASFYLVQLAREISASSQTLIGAGDVYLARKLPPIVEQMRRAESVFKKKVTNEITKRLTIEDILNLQSHQPIELIRMVAALHPDWAELCGVEDGEKLLRLPKDELRRLLLNEKTRTLTRNGVKVEEKGKHRLAEFIEDEYETLEMQGSNINYFVENLWGGRLWSGPNATFEDCDWPTQPQRKDVTAWMKLIMPHLKKVTNNDPMKLGVFQHMLAARCSVYDGQSIDSDKGARLATAPHPSDIWSQVGAEIRKAWIRLEKLARKPVSGKTA